MENKLLINGGTKLFGRIPPTGLPLLFISSGGTSVAVFMAAIGVCLNISQQNRV